MNNIVFAGEFNTIILKSKFFVYLKSEGRYLHRPRRSLNQLNIEKNGILFNAHRIVPKLSQLGKDSYGFCSLLTKHNIYPFNHFIVFYLYYRQILKKYGKKINCNDLNILLFVKKQAFLSKINKFFIFCAVYFKESSIFEVF